MTSIVNSALAGFTVTYGSPTVPAERVQFGGSDAAYSSTPPMYGLRGEFVYDESRRTVIGAKYVLTVSCTFFGASESGLATNMAAVRRILSAPGRTLTIRGTGIGFGNLGTGDGLISDIDNGPRPLSIQCNPIGNHAWECVWSVEFTVSECAAASSNPLLYMAFNFDTTWQNDFEGITNRTITGYVQIALRRNAAAPKQPTHVADAVRDTVKILIPEGFRRRVNTWHEPDAKNIVRFVVLDEQLPGDPPPKDCTIASGMVGFQSGDGMGGFAEADVTLGMDIRVGPKTPRNLAGFIFLSSVISKQALMADSLAAGEDKGTVIPAHISIVNGKFDEARVTRCSMRWKLTKCLNAMMLAAGIWKPVKPDGTFGNEDIIDPQTWRTSVEDLWGNRGTTLLGSLASESVIIDVCSNATQATIGNTSPQSASSQFNGVKSLTCPDVPEDGGWLAHDLRLRILRKDRQTWHTLARSYLPQTSVSTGQSENSPNVAIAGPAYTQSASDLDIVEHHGYPQVYIALQFKGLRMKRKPVMPELKSIGGRQVTFVSTSSPTATPAFSVFTCPVWFMSGWTIYRVSGHVSEVAPAGSPSLCGAPSVSQTY